MSYRRIGLMLVLGAVLAADAPAQTQTTSAFAPLIEQPKPEYPMSERGREGWVLLNYTVSDDGVVVDLSIEDSSGNDAFNEAALNAVRDWRFESAEQQKSNVLLNFVRDRKRVHVSRRFFASNAKVHTSIDNGELGDAQERIDAIRNNDDLNAFELAYSYIAEGHLAAERGDQVEQLRCFRRAMLNQGRWLKRDKYLRLLYAAIVLEIQQQDFASALRDYSLLTETSPGRKMAADLEEPIQAVRALAEKDVNIAPPYMAANIEMTIEHKVHDYREYDLSREGAGTETLQREQPTPSQERR